VLLYRSGSVLYSCTCSDKYCTLVPVQGSKGAPVLSRTRCSLPAKASSLISRLCFVLCRGEFYWCHPKNGHRPRLLLLVFSFPFFPCFFCSAGVTSEWYHSKNFTIQHWVKYMAALSLFSLLFWCCAGVTLTGTTARTSLPSCRGERDAHGKVPSPCSVYGCLPSAGCAGVTSTGTTPRSSQSTAGFRSKGKFFLLRPRRSFLASAFCCAGATSTGTTPKTSLSTAPSWQSGASIRCRTWPWLCGTGWRS